MCQTIPVIASSTNGKILNMRPNIVSSARFNAIGHEEAAMVYEQEKHVGGTSRKVTAMDVMSSYHVEIVGELPACLGTCPRTIWPPAYRK